ncbi:MAG TPA: NAD-dependent epimerase/dehydratase family protein [Caldilineae bacterium]|nr:NAD-dependent epimerase/dehydratase family protein [Caldilineae bacterium]
MDVQRRTILILGGAGMVGKAVCRRLLREHPAHLVIASIDQQSAEQAANQLLVEAPPGTEISACWGNIFVRWDYKDISWAEILEDDQARPQVLDDLLGSMTGERKRDILESSTLARFVHDYHPDAIVDCINTATAFAYQDIYTSAHDLLQATKDGNGVASQKAVEQHLLKLYIPQVVRHMQILHAVLAADPDNGWPGLKVYVKVGTSGTGGMGLNIPYTHGEEKPSSVLLSKTAVAGAHSLLLFLLARTPPDRPVIKEIKPTAAIGCAEIDYGPIRRRGRPIPMYDCPPDQTYPVEVAKTPDGDFGVALPDKVLENVYIDTGENGLFALGEFSSITSVNQMEFVTPEEIARYVAMEMMGGNSGFDVISALDQSVLGPTYRAGILREGALSRMKHLEKMHNTRSVAFELLGPPRLSKLLFEAYLLQQISGDSVARVMAMTPEVLAQACYAEIKANADLRAQIISIGIPILLPDGERILRGPHSKADNAEAGWVDLRPQNMTHWQQRLTQIRKQTEHELAQDAGMYSSRFYRIFVDPATGDVKDSIGIGDLAGWIFTFEEKGARMKS